MITIEQKCNSNEPASEQLVLPFELRCKSRLRSRLASGEEVGLFLERGTILRGGDVLKGNDGRVVQVVAANEHLLEIRCDTPEKLSRVAYHLGNRHVAVEVGSGWLRIEVDNVLKDMVLGLGAQVIEIDAPFEPESGAYAHGHQHTGSLPGAKIHQYGVAQ